uniref:Uncharacterized protein n=1 Tax=Triticum urartu TaxID=4572 RepID=A0A8R7PEB5_TRIUA
VPPPPHLLPPPSTRAAAAPPYSSCHARRCPDLPCRTLLPGSYRRPDHISTSSGHRRAPISPSSHTVHLVLVGLHNHSTGPPQAIQRHQPGPFIAATLRIWLPPCRSHGDVRWSTSSLSCCREAQLLHCGVSCKK